eukprot:jgi/Botrbrau1/23364/Bobra.0051s0017.1
MDGIWPGMGGSNRIARLKDSNVDPPCMGFLHVWCGHITFCTVRFLLSKIGD